MYMSAALWSDTTRTLSSVVLNKIHFEAWYFSVMLLLQDHIYQMNVSYMELYMREIPLRADW